MSMAERPGRSLREGQLSHAEAEDVAQDCKQILAEKLPAFEYSSRRGAFRGYLYVMVNNRINNLFKRRRPVRLASEFARRLADTGAELENRWETQWMQHHLAHCLQRIEQDIMAKTMRIFRMHAVDGVPVKEVCDKLNVSANEVHLAKSRVTRRLRHEMTALLGDSE
jgi:RNA polymerase sigma factor (sigma-70 family)